MSVGNVLFWPDVAIYTQLACCPRHLTQGDRCRKGKHRLSIDQPPWPEDSSNMLPWCSLSMAVNLDVQQNELIRGCRLTASVWGLLKDKGHICGRLEVRRRHLHLVQSDRVCMCWPFPKSVKLLKERQWSGSVKGDKAVLRWEVKDMSHYRAQWAANTGRGGEISSGSARSWPLHQLQRICCLTNVQNIAAVPTRGKGTLQ